MHLTIFVSPKKPAGKQKKDKKSSVNVPNDVVIDNSIENNGSDDDDDKRNEDKVSKMDGEVDDVEEDEQRMRGGPGKSQSQLCGQ